MMPKPPTWMSPRITACPKGVQKVAVSTTTSPVRHTAEVAVKIPSRGGTEPSPRVEMGRERRTAPITINSKNEPAVNRAACKLGEAVRFRPLEAVDGAC